MTNEKNTPVLAICYDFDKTLSPCNMQEQGFIRDIGWTADAFWRESDRLARRHGMDPNLAYMYLMVREAKGKIPLTRSALQGYGAQVALYPGVAEWFERIREYGSQAGVQVEHYILSSGLREMIEGTLPYRQGAFEAVYASAFVYGTDGEALWPAMAVNYTGKTQYLFRIKKGVLDTGDDRVNDYFTDDQFRVPFRNMVYIGDSATDIPCMKVVNSYGGHSVGVYDPACGDSLVRKLLREDRVRYAAPADYREGMPLDRLLRDIIRKTAADEQLLRCHRQSLEGR